MSDGSKRHWPQKQPSWPALCRLSTTLLGSARQDVDSRHKAGHDEGGVYPKLMRLFFLGYLPPRFPTRVDHPRAALRGRPPFAPFARDATAFAAEVFRPAMRASSRAIQAFVPKIPATRAGT